MSGGDVRGNIRRGGACRLNSHVSYDLGRLGRTTGVHHGRGRIQYCNRLIGWDKRVCRNFQVMRLDLGPWNEPKLMRGNFAGITHGPSCGAARVANAIGYNIFSPKYSVVRSQEDLGHANAVGEHSCLKNENKQKKVYRERKYPRGIESTIL
jgi:hypothetical protein